MMKTMTTDFEHNICLFALAFCISLLAGCYKAPSHDYSSNGRSKSSAEYAKDGSADVDDTMVISHVNQFQHSTVNGQSRQFVKTAKVSFEVKDVYKTALILEDMAIKSGGFVIHNSVINSIQNARSIKTDNGVQTVVESYEPIGSVTLRVPHQKLQQFLRSMVKHADFMYSRDFDAQDVLLDIIKQDQLAKLNTNAQSEISQGTKSTDKNNDPLAEKVYATDIKTQYQHAKVLADIQKADFEDRVAYSTITVELRQSPLIRTYTQSYFPYAVEQAQPTFAYQIEENIEAGWENFLWFIFSLVSLWPFMIFFTMLYFLWRTLRKWWKKRKLRNKRTNTTS